MKNETNRPMTRRQYREVIATVVRAVPFDLDYKHAQMIIGAKSDFFDYMADALTEWLRLKLIQEIQKDKKVEGKSIPIDGEVFELTLDGDDPKNDPLEMVRSDGYHSGAWKHRGKRISGVQTRQFWLACVGLCANLDEVREKLKEHGKIPQGQWREAFKAKYPRPDGNGPIGIADPSWVDPDGDAYYPSVDSFGCSLFRWAGHDKGEDWRWLVEVSE